MTSNGKRERYSKGEVVGTLNFSEIAPFPKNIFSLKAAVKDKNKMVMMLNAIQERSDLSESDVKLIREQLKLKEVEQFKEMEEKAALDSLKEKPVQWTRDHKGNIVSPFKSEKFKIKS